MFQILNLLGWATAAVIALLVLYGLYDSSGMKVLSNDLSAFYNATNRTAWGLAMSWVVLACATGHGGKYICNFHKKHGQIKQHFLKLSRN